MQRELLQMTAIHGGEQVARAAGSKSTRAVLTWQGTRSCCC